MLGQFGFEEDAKHVLPLLKDESWPTRIAAAEAWVNWATPFLFPI
jgi:HEAT repeat protein